MKAGKQGIEGDEGGHLIATLLNGAGEKINLLPMNANLNRGVWKQMENKWVKALEEGKTVKVKIEPIYNSSGIRPYKFEVSYYIDGKDTIYKDFYNRPHGGN
ncbi:DNA/RNA non-specific endonuclease [Gilliamella sp. B2776]|uniref:DNA/RNA non-specific endonuclease n=1 Tax=unclassified Gilliamella TaxID=2685620 RepID=UPI00226A0FAD|nr:MULTISPECIES: DNA/RNA non-specific endonuclease [unclassified Gilliamella]MCX8648769.1 DNA/RNA non-specific endonuclease [Gilliamella sp. B2779]MCX8653355.1 DNA/RNA non-specific endonuclease [Gilliamella sp. B2737]MCX8655631.1 DNA/RNA non-specific endonuclease [Gilliamella sp. B2894]MCX8664381.1 DNA/RNA non-specific endonuclease [Gilliamella sp. B2887]MCX8690581.1 DNA/RNA non-specific endonuclease [Gilliamella sp. B2776]